MFSVIQHGFAAGRDPARSRGAGGHGTPPSRPTGRSRSTWSWSSASSSRSARPSTAASSFALNEKLDQVVVKVIDSDTDKIIKEIPPAELQHVHERIREVIGILFDERA
ncbi:MAG: flagellar protein FlaG [Chromatiales bacterium]|nr:flagellar protein FlaG [Chromatiales bacterium]